jgi:polar amino acid transport system substrate-binding protein
MRKKTGTRTLGVLAAAAATAMVAAACSEGAHAPSSGEAYAGPPTTAGPSGSAAPAAKPCGPEATAAAWNGSLPAPGALPDNGRIGQIVKAGHLTVGIDVNTELFGYDPNHTGVPQGFDIDMARLVGKAIFPDFATNPNRIEYRVVTLSGAQNGEIPQLAGGKVDLVVRTTTITCARLQNVNFSNPYYVAQQRLLMPLGADGQPQKYSLADLKGKGLTVCATANSTAYQTIVQALGAKWADGEPNALDCLVKLERHEVDGISTDDAILRGMAAQDPRVAITTAAPINSQPYGILTAKGSDGGTTDLTQLVNTVLAKAIADGDWADLYTNDLHSQPGAAPTAPEHYPQG